MNVTVIQQWQSMSAKRMILLLTNIICTGFSWNNGVVSNAYKTSKKLN